MPGIRHRGGNAMFSAISAELARDRELELRQIDRTGRRRLAGLLRFGRPKAVAPVETNVTIRVAGPADDEGLARLRRLGPPEAVPPAETTVTPGVAGPADDEGLARLAELDSRPAPVGYVLVAEVGGELRAAMPVTGGETVADPFHPTATLTSLLALRVSQLRGGELEPLAPARRRGLVTVPNR